MYSKEPVQHVLGFLAWQMHALVAYHFNSIRDHTQYFGITELFALMLCTAEMTYEHARLCIAINFKIEYWPLPKLAKGIKENYT
jgi:hypothetical protein